MHTICKLSHAQTCRLALVLERVGFDRIHEFTGQVEAAFVKHNAFNLSGEFNLTRHALALDVSGSVDPVEFQQ